MSKNRKVPEPANAKRVYTSQSDVPRYSLEESVELAKALSEHFNGEAAPHELANAVGNSPTSSSWRYLTGAAVSYGLTEGAYNSMNIRLSDLGKRVATPEDEGDDKKALQEAALRPRVMRQFFEKYNRGKFPQETIGINVLTSMGVQRDKAKDVYEMVRSTGLLVGFVTQTKTGLYVALHSTSSVPVTSGTDDDPPVVDDAANGNGDKTEPQVPAPVKPVVVTPATPKNSKVFITHGKNRSIVEQLKEILKFGKFDPMVAVEHETPSRPVPDKVLTDMRACFASVIHVESEEELLTHDGKAVQKINENVLIEIGASMALYGNNFVLLVKKGIHLPSNLQGLYRCEYEGDKLDYEATMKLLKAFNEFR